jgi:hypothetical protein
MCRTQVLLERGVKTDFKFLVRTSNGDMLWEAGLNRHLCVPDWGGGGIIAEFDKAGEELVCGCVGVWVWV